MGDNDNAPNRLDPAQVASGSGGDGKRPVRRLGGPDDETAPLGPVNPYISSLSLLIGATGSVSALHLFIWLAFAHPDAANIIIPIVLTPLFTYLVNRYKYARKTPCERCQQTESD